MKNLNQNSRTLVIGVLILLIISILLTYYKFIALRDFIVIDTTPLEVEGDSL